MRLSLDASRATTRVHRIACLYSSRMLRTSRNSSSLCIILSNCIRISHLRGNIRRKLERRNWTRASEQAFDMRATTQPDDIADTS